MSISKTLNQIIETVEAEGADVINVPTAYIYRIDTEVKDEFIHQYNMVTNLLNRVVSLQEQVKSAYLEGWDSGANSYSPYEEREINYSPVARRDERDWEDSEAKTKLFARNVDNDQ